ncbi:hypothetical protein E2542_SST22582 [Spatholobus suberectus]|nr:hypothetical protein E2542_SST22582 [Spatholobus suberectus]
MLLTLVWRTSFATALSRTGFQQRFYNNQTIRPGYRQAYLLRPITAPKKGYTLSNTLILSSLNVNLHPRAARDPPSTREHDEAGVRPLRLGLVRWWRYEGGPEETVETRRSAVNGVVAA